MSEENKGWEKFEAVIPFEVKELVETDLFYEFKGYASIFNIPDKINDIVIPGAFKRTIDHHPNGHPIAWMHDKKDIIGSAQLYEDKKGLRVSPGRLVKGIQRAEDVYRLMKAKVVDGMSFSFRPIRRSFQGKYRHLKELAMGEVTLGPSSMICHPGALVTDVKFLSAGTIFEDHLDRLREIIGIKVWKDEDNLSKITHTVCKEEDFVKLRSWWVDSEKSVRAFGGPLKSDGRVTVQSVQFDKQKGWTLDRSKEWVRGDELKFYAITARMSFALSTHDIKIGSA